MNDHFGIIGLFACSTTIKVITSNYLEITERMLLRQVWTCEWRQVWTQMWMLYPTVYVTHVMW